MSDATRPPLWETPRELCNIAAMMVGQDASVPLGTPGLDGRPNQQFVILWNAYGFREEADWLFEWLGRKLQFDPGSAWDEQRPFFCRLIREFFAGADEGGAAWFVLQTTRVHIGQRLKGIFTQKPEGDPVPLCPDLDLKDVRFNFFDFSLKGEEVQMVGRPCGPEADPYVTQVDVERTITAARPLYGLERWYCNADPRTDFDLLRAGRIPAGKRFCPDGTSVNLVPIFSLVRATREGLLTRFAAQLHPYTGHTFDLRAASLELEMSLRMDPREHELLQRALGRYREKWRT